LSNVYGPDQDIAKPQGLVSHIARAHLLRQPLGIYVPLDTVRDYLFAADAGELVADCLERAHAERPGHRLKILASQQGVTIGTVIAEMGRLRKRRAPVVFGETATTRLQAADLRVRSVVWQELDRRPMTPLPVGLAAVVAGMSRLQASGRLGG
jgi:UDP-glucose 4-epimerase